MLALASRNTKDPNYGTAIFLANIELGEAVLKRSDRAEAVRHLLAASERAAPWNSCATTRSTCPLPGSLVDAGERSAVAKFLDRCAKFNKRRHTVGGVGSSDQKRTQPEAVSKLQRVPSGWIAPGSDAAVFTDSSANARKVGFSAIGRPDGAGVSFRNPRFSAVIGDFPSLRTLVTGVLLFLGRKALTPE